MQSPPLGKPYILSPISTTPGEKVTRKQQKKPAKRKSESERAWEKIKGKYPNCVGVYPGECPPEIEDKNDPPTECKTCPVYMEKKKS